MTQYYKVPDVSGELISTYNQLGLDDLIRFNSTMDEHYDIENGIITAVYDVDATATLENTPVYLVTEILDEFVSSTKQYPDNIFTNFVCSLNAFHDLYINTNFEWREYIDAIVTLSTTYTYLLKNRYRKEN